MNRRINLSPLADTSLIDEAWIEIADGLAPLLCWRDRSLIHKADLSSLLNLTVDFKPLYFDDEAGGGLNGATKYLLVVECLERLASPYCGRFEIRWVPDDGVPF